MENKGKSVTLKYFSILIKINREQRLFQFFEAICNLGVAGSASPELGWVDCVRSGTGVPYSG